MLLAIPCGRDHIDIMTQTKALQSGFIQYLASKQAAGIVNVAEPGSASQQVSIIASDQPNNFFFASSFGFVCLLFYAIATVIPLFQGGDMMYEMRRRKSEPTLFPTERNWPLMVL